MDILQLIDRLEELFNESKSIPLTRNVMVDEDRMLDIIDQMRIAIPEEVKKAQQLLGQRDRVLAQAQEEANRTLELARQKADQMVGKDMVMQEAQRRAAKGGRGLGVAHAASHHRRGAVAAEAKAITAVAQGVAQRPDRRDVRDLGGARGALHPFREPQPAVERRLDHHGQGFGSGRAQQRVVPPEPEQVAEGHHYREGYALHDPRNLQHSKLASVPTQQVRHVEKGRSSAGVVLLGGKESGKEELEVVGWLDVHSAP